MSYAYSINQYYYPPRQIYLNSRFATSTVDPVKNNRCLFSIETIQMPTTYDNLLVAVDDAQIPISFTTINENNNRIFLRIVNAERGIEDYFPEDFDQGTSDWFTIPNGNYDAYKLAHVLQEKVNLWFRTTYGNQFTRFRVMYEIATNRFTFKVTSSYQIGPQKYSLLALTVGFDSAASSSLWGFKYPTTGSELIEYTMDRLIGEVVVVDLENSSIFRFKNTLTSPFSADLAGSRFVFVQCPTFGTVNVNSKTGSVNQIIAKIPITEDYLSIQHYINRGYTNKIHNNKSITVIEINLLDEYLNDINFNGADWAITLTLVILGTPPEQLTVANENGNLDISQNNNVVQ